MSAADSRAPAVSVITPMYNSAATIESTLASVLAQSFGDWESLVIDDASTDDGAARVAALAARDPRIRLLENRFGKGPAGARNTGIAAARGRYVAFLDSDDLWYPEKLEKQVAFMQDTGAVLSYSAFNVVSADGRRKRLRAVPTEVDYDALSGWNCIGCLTAMYDQERVGKQYMPDLKLRQDWGLWLKIVRESRVPARGISEPLADLRLRKGSISSNKLRSTVYSFRLLHEFERLGFFRSLRCVITHSLRAVR